MTQSATPELESLLSLSARVSKYVYLAVLLLGLAALVLVVQKPVATDSDFLRIRYTDNFCESLIERHGDLIEKHFGASKVRMPYPDRDIVMAYIDEEEFGERVGILNRFLNDQRPDRDRWVLSLMDVVDIGQAMRDHVEKELLKSETVTVPILQSRVASGVFAIALAFAFMAVHFNSYCHRLFLRTARRQAPPGSLFVIPSLMVAESADLLVLPDLERKIVGWLQMTYIYVSPYMVVICIAWHIYRIEGAFGSHTRLVVAAVSALVYSILLSAWGVYSSKRRRKGSVSGNLLDSSGD